MKINTYKRLLSFWALLFSCIFLGQAQTPYTVVATGLKTPSGLEIDASNRLWLTQAGTGRNDGSVSILKSDGTLQPVLKDLPSLFDTAVQEVSGAWHTLMLPNNQFALVQGEGRNENSGSLLFFNMTNFTPGTTAAMTAANNVRKIAVSSFMQRSGIAASNPYSAALDGTGNIYVSDAAANTIARFNATNAGTIVTTLPNLPNPTSVGPPAINQVPTRIIARRDGGFYVATLTGFPFFEGSATIYAISPTGTITTYKTGLSLIADLAYDANTGDLYALQLASFSLQTFGFIPNSSKITRIKANGTTETIATGFGPASALALDPSGNLFVAETFSGRVLKFPALRNITVTVDMTGQTVSPKGVYVGHDLGGIWKPNGTKMTAAGNGIYTATLQVPQGTKVRYKFINGDSWGDNESVQSGCGERNIYGYYDRVATAGDMDFTVPVVCFGACMPCGNRVPQSGYDYCPRDPNLIYCENFEGLQHGKLVPQVPNWTTVDLLFAGSTVPTATDIPLVTGFWNGFTNFDGSRALRIHFNDFSGQFDHPLMYMGYPNEGTFQLDFRMYIPKRNTGYIGFSDTSRNNFTLLFKNDSLSFLSRINYSTFVPQRIGTPVAYRQDNWNDISLVFNAATKKITVKVNNATVFSDINKDQKGFGFLEMGALDLNELFPKSSEFFIDDLVYRRIPNQPQIQELPQTVARVAAVSPNPAHEKLVISPDSDTRNNWQIRLINPLGQVMTTQQGSAATPIEMATNDYKSGIYIVEFQSATTRWTKKVMIQH